MKRPLIAFAAIMIFAGVGCQDRGLAPPSLMPQKVSFFTADKVTIVGNYYAGKDGGPAALLLHMMPATKESWDAFASFLISKGFGSVLAIDERGHGESTRGDGTTLDYRNFSDSDQQAKIKDVEAAVEWLETKHGVAPERLAVVGASIGANLAIIYGSAHPEIKAVAALSPGLDYSGVATEDAARKMIADQKLFLAASADDAYSLESVKTLAAIKKNATLKEYDDAGHATRMFDKKPELMNVLSDWLAASLK